MALFGCPNFGWAIHSQVSPKPLKTLKATFAACQRAWGNPSRGKLSRDYLPYTFGANWTWQVCLAASVSPNKEEEEKDISCTNKWDGNEGKTRKHPKTLNELNEWMVGLVASLWLHRRYSILNEDNAYLRSGMMTLSCLLLCFLLRNSNIDVLNRTLRMASPRWPAKKLEK